MSPSSSSSSPDDDRPPPLTEPNPLKSPPLPSPRSKPITSPFPHLPTLLLLLPYLIGIIWIFLHPIISITTGELKCRGSFIDENAFMLDYYTTSSYDDVRLSSSLLVANNQSDSLCHFLSLANDDVLTPEICTTHHHRRPHHAKNNNNHPRLVSFDVATIASEKSLTTTPRDAIVLVLPPPPPSRTWQSSDFHAGALELMTRLTASSPWLSRSVTIVAGRRDDDASSSSLEDVVEGFVRSHVGYEEEEEEEFETTTTRIIDPHRGGYLVRHAIVFDVAGDDGGDDTPSSPRRHRSRWSSSPITILPQGRRGVLPNLDYVFGIIKSFRQQGGDVRIHLHPLGDVVEGWERWLMGKLGGKVGETGREYVRDLMGMLAFATVLALGPYPPHSSFLQRGIDSVTIRTTLPSSSSSSPYLSPPTAHLLRTTEHFIHGLSNLHERLHHSVQQYLLPSSTKFVSNGEYTYPALLIILPMVMRGLWLLVREVRVFMFWEMMEVLLVVGFGVVGGGAMVVVGGGWGWGVRSGFVGSYVGALILLKLIAMRRRQMTKTTTTTTTSSVDDDFKHNDEWRKNLRCLSCAVAIYLHVPLILTNVSLALPSALFFSLPFSVGSSTTSSSSKWWIAVRRILWMMVLFVTWPPVGLVPRVFGEYTPYVLVLYTPLHLLLMCLWVL